MGPQHIFATSPKTPKKRAKSRKFFPQDFSNFHFFQIFKKIEIFKNPQNLRKTKKIDNNWRKKREGGTFRPPRLASSYSPWKPPLFFLPLLSIFLVFLRFWDFWKFRFFWKFEKMKIWKILREYFSRFCSFFLGVLGLVAKMCWGPHGPTSWIALGRAMGGKSDPNDRISARPGSTGRPHP